MMNQRKALFLAAIIGVIAIVLAAVLLLLGRKGDQESALEIGYKSELVDAAAMARFVETLSSDALEGRAAGSTGGDAARGFILKRYETLKLRPLFETGYTQNFPIIASERHPDAGTGVNVVGWLAGKTPGEGPVLVMTAHYDHLGIRDGEIYNGADDNASGVSAMIAIAQYLTEHPPKHDVIFAAVDAEEIGFLGTKALVRAPAFPMDRVALNINLDMVSRSDAGELYVAGTSHTPELAGMVDEIADLPVTLLKGHDTPDLGVNDWTLQSDHAVFFEAGVPFLYFGVEDHAGYHKPTDDYSDITLDFYVRSGDALAMIAQELDSQLGEIAALHD